jgi:hypothetical protein
MSAPTTQNVFSAVESAYTHERESGFLCLEALRSDATFAAAEYMALTRDTTFLARCPAWLVAELYEWARGFRATGGHRVISNLGEADHSGLMSSVIAVLPPVESLGERVNLKTRVVPGSSGKTGAYYTYYENCETGAEVLHGLRREYLEDGSLRETEFVDGERAGSVRKFGPDGSRIE